MEVTRGPVPTQYQNVTYQLVEVTRGPAPLVEVTRGPVHTQNVTYQTGKTSCGGVQETGRQGQDQCAKYPGEEVVVTAGHLKAGVYKTSGQGQDQCVTYI